MKLKRVLAELNQEHTTHPSKEQFILFIEDKLDEKEKEEFFKHLATCTRCREVLKTATELKKEEEQLQHPVNNPYYKKIIKPLAIAASFIIIFLAVPIIDKSSQPKVVFKGAPVEKNIFIEAVAYWEKLLNKIFNKKNSQE